MHRRELIAALSALAGESLLGTSRATPDLDKAKSLSLIRLIANPNTFDGQKLRLAGYLDYNGVDRAVGLYVSELDGRNAIFSNSIDLRLDEAAATTGDRRDVFCYFF